MLVAVDIETRSKIDLKKAGLHRYAEDESTELLCVAWNHPKRPPEIWYPGLEELSQYSGDELDELADLIADPDVTFTAWNAQFETENWKHCCVAAGLPPVPDEKWHCTQGDAAMCAYPLALGKCAKALGLPVDKQKDAAGTRLITKLCKPMKDGTFRSKEDFLEDYKALYEYCKQDVVTESAIYQALPYHVYGFEEQIQRFTWLSNLRGVPVDDESVRAIFGKLGDHLKNLDEEIQVLSEGRLNSPRQRDALLKDLECNRDSVAAEKSRRDAILVSSGKRPPRWLVKDTPGIALDNLRGETLGHILGDPERRAEFSEYDISLMELRRDVSHSSTAKFKKILIQLCADGTVKGNIQYHGAATGRDAARGFQIQNLPRNTAKYPETIIDIFKSYSSGDIDRTIGPLLEAASGLIRPMICAPKGEKLVISDYSQIEARGTAWLCRERRVLDEFREGIDPYKAQAAKMYGVPLGEVDKEQRQYGKLAVLACIAEGQRVLTDHGLVPIEQVTTCMRLWDGVEWVSHEGVVHRGIQKTMRYDGLQATNDHIVYTEEGGEVELQAAARKSARLAETGIGGTPIRYGVNNAPGNEGRERFSQDPSGVPGMPRKEMDQYEQFAFGKNRGLPKMQPAPDSPAKVNEEMSSGKTAVPMRNRRGVQTLRRKRDRVSIRNSLDHGVVGYRKSGAPSGQRDRPKKQRGPLRTGKSSVGDTKIEHLEQTGIAGTSFSRIPKKASECPVCGHNFEKFTPKAYRSRDSVPIPFTELQTERPVWDILNAGSRNRFTVEGRLVHNCGYQGGHKALTKFAGGYGLRIERKEAAGVVKLFRESRPLLVEAWKNFSGTAMGTVLSGVARRVPGCQMAMFRREGTHLTLELPSGRKLWYPNARVETVQIKYEDVETGKEKIFETQAVTREGSNITGNWERSGISGGNLLQNWVQAACRDIMMEAVPRLENAGYEVIMRVHDEIGCLTPDTPSFSIETMDELMCVPPSWCSDFQVTSAGYESKRYRK